MLLNDKTYDLMKRLVQVIMPASATLYFAIAQIWGLPNAEGVMGTIAAIATFTGVVLGISTSQYHNSDRPYEGTLSVSESEDGHIYTLELNSDPESLVNQRAITFRVEDPNHT